MDTTSEACVVREVRIGSTGGRHLHLQLELYVEQPGRVYRCILSGTVCALYFS